MQEISNILDYTDFISLFITLFLLRFVARTMSIDRLDVVVWSRRFAAAAMFSHAALMLIDKEPSTAYAVAGIAFRSLLTGAFALWISKIVLATAISLHSFTMQPVAESVRRRRDHRRWEAERLQREHDEEERRRRAQEEWERQAPQRERERRQAEKRARQAAEQARQARIDQLRREQIRLECELFYARYAPEMGKRFSSDEFNTFVKKYMRDDMHPHDVETRAKHLQTIIKHHADKCEPPAQFNSLNDIATWYAEQVTQADTIADERLRRLVLAQLKARYAELTTHLLEEIEQ
jgi:hypothetical protein